MAPGASPSWTFQPLFELGRGGVAVVRAERMIDPDGRARVAAVKRLLPMVAESRETRRMFLDEARLAALLQHPNVVRILAYGEQDEPFIAMEMVRGETLASLVNRARGQAPLSPELAVFVALNLCHALHAAHELRDPDSGDLLHLVHRDLSPQNVLVGYDGTVHLTDFGIAKAMGYGARTRTGDIKGKVPYMSPEQAMGEDVDRRSDLFALGAVLFESLCGRRMLGEGNEIDMLRRLATEPPPPIETAWPDAPRRARALFAGLTQREPANRPDTADRVARELQAVLADLGAKPTAETLAQRVQMLAPGRKQQLEQRLEESQIEAERQQPYLQEIESFVERPSVLFRERRRARAMLGLGIAALVAAIAFGIAFATTRPGAKSASAPPDTDAAVAATSEALPPPSATPAPQPPPETSASADAAAAPPEPTTPPTPPVRPAPAKPDDGLDENPF